MKSIAAAADHHYGRMWEDKCDDEAFLEYLDERGITWKQYEKECHDAQLDAAADAAFWMDHE